TVETWIAEGAKGPAQAEVDTAIANRSNHWSFQPIRNPQPPVVANAQWVKNPIDQFVLHRLEQEKIAPSPAADKVTLLRRVTLDLTGLPPTPEEVAAFVQDNRPDAYQRVVDRLLKSPHYGEMQARYWLDAARYADSNGFSIDSARTMWKYRDWVIDAFNRDMPFSQFTIEQLAGDLLPNATQSQLIATGFHRNTLRNEEGGVDQEQFRVEAIVDRVNTTGTVWLGLTIGCCQCHDHKFDPISQREYYQFYAFFNQCDEPNLAVETAETRAAKKKIQTAIQALEHELKYLDSTTLDRVEQWRGEIADEDRDRLPKNLMQLLLLPPNGRTPKQEATLLASYRQNEQLRYILGNTNGWSALTNISLLQIRTSMYAELARLEKLKPQTINALIMKERTTPRKTTVLIGGDFTRPGVEVGTGFPKVLPAGKENNNRLDLAKWIVDPANPLTARVVVNRYWQQFFGLGLVETENDFGTQGTLPSHPELLDWLATSFKQNNWSVKQIHRLIVTSATYQQSSAVREELATKDARNLFLARQNRLRVPAETVRDIALASAGLLSREIGGPSVFPPQPEGVYRFTQVNKNWKADIGAKRHRRGMYTFFWRSAPHPQLVVFDAPEGNTTCTRRNRSNTPLQALTLLNDSAFLEYAQALAGRIKNHPSDRLEEKIDYGFQLCLARTPNTRERARLIQFVEEQQAYYETQAAEAQKLSPGDPTLAPWIMLSRVLLNLDETITRE
ncbi:MAG: DUF1549 and DUF1553 domain-containing protein, partial [Zavarzinella sp.]